MAMDAQAQSANDMPNWIPQDVRHYIAHTENGISIRALARGAGCHASTILRQVRKCETRRDDLLVDLAMRRIGAHAPHIQSSGTTSAMHSPNPTHETALPDEDALRNEAPRVLRRLNEPGACLAIAENMDKAVVVRDADDGQTLRTAVVDRAIAEALALNAWVEMTTGGRITRYRITVAGRHALKKFLAEDEAKRAGMSEATTGFEGPKTADGAKQDVRKGRPRIRYSAAESPLLVLSRRREKDGTPFLTPEQVAAGERLREDFELAQLKADRRLNWDGFVGGLAEKAESSPSAHVATRVARDRVSRVLNHLGPGLGDVALRCCCFLEGMEETERRMGWSARSGKIVLRIALTQMKRFYDESGEGWSPLIG